MKHRIAPLLTLPVLAALALGCQQKPAKPAKTAVAKSKVATQAKKPSSKPSSQPKTSAVVRGTTPESRAQVDQDGVVRRGAALSGKKVLTVAELVAQSDKLSGQTVAVKGKIESVCQKKGCWMMLKDGDQSVRITSKGYKFFVPKTAPGQLATVEGELAVKTLDVKTAQHYEEERVMGKKEAPKKVTAPQKEISIASLGLEIRKG